MTEDQIAALRPGDALEVIEGDRRDGMAFPFRLGERVVFSHRRADHPADLYLQGHPWSWNASRFARPA